MDHWIKLFPKLAQGVLFALLVLRELKKGYFTGAKERFRVISIYSYSWSFLLSLTAVILVMLLADSALLHAIQALNNSLAQLIFDFGRQMGRQILVIVIALYLIGFLAKQDRFCRMIFSLVLSSGLTALLITIFKFTILRARPYGDLGPYSFLNFPGLVHDERVFQSFPSGDVALVAGVAGYIFWKWRRSIFSWFVLLLPISTALSRISLNRHWPSDTLTSILIGLFVGHVMVSFENQPQTQKII